MASTSFKMRCLECGRNVPMESYWRHLELCRKKTRERQTKPSPPQDKPK